jgi:hypothetical protein
MDIKLVTIGLYAKVMIVLSRSGVLETARLYMGGERCLALPRPKFRGLCRSTPAPAAFPPKSLPRCFPAQISGHRSHHVNSLRPIFRRGWFPHGPCIPNGIFPITLARHPVNYHVICQGTLCYFYVCWGTWNNRYPTWNHNAQNMMIMEIIEPRTPRACSRT